MVVILTTFCAKEKNVDPGPDPAELLLPELPVDFFCLVNDDPWRPEAADPGTPVSYIWYSESKGELLVRANRELVGLPPEEISETFSVFQRGITAAGAYPADSLLTNFRDFIQCGLYQIDLSAPATVTILKLDTTEDFISGQFEFTVRSTSCSRTLRVSRGRFEGKYRAY